MRLKSFEASSVREQHQSSTFAVVLKIDIPIWTIEGGDPETEKIVIELNGWASRTGKEARNAGRARHEAIIIRTWTLSLICTAWNRERQSVDHVQPRGAWTSLEFFSWLASRDHSQTHAWRVLAQDLPASLVNFSSASERCFIKTLYHPHHMLTNGCQLHKISAGRRNWNCFLEGNALTNTCWNGRANAGTVIIWRSILNDKWLSQQTSIGNVLFECNNTKIETETSLRCKWNTGFFTPGASPPKTPFVWKSSNLDTVANALFLKPRKTKRLPRSFERGMNKFRIFYWLASRDDPQVNCEEHQKGSEIATIFKC